MQKQVLVIISVLLLSIFSVQAQRKKHQPIIQRYVAANGIYELERYPRKKTEEIALVIRVFVGEEEKKWYWVG